MPAMPAVPAVPAVPVLTPNPYSHPKAQGSEHNQPM